MLQGPNEWQETREKITKKLSLELEPIQRKKWGSYNNVLSCEVYMQLEYPSFILFSVVILLDSYVFDCDKINSMWEYREGKT